MARKKSRPAAAAGPGALLDLSAPKVGHASRADDSDTPSAATAASAVLLGLMLLLVPALGVPSETFLQDSFKSMLVAGFGLLALLAHFLQQRTHPGPLLWHPLLWLPLGLALYALGSMVWSEPYLAGVESARWLVLAGIAWIGLQVWRPSRMPLLLWSIHGGAALASVWAAAQFWGDLDWFPQGPNPASTFVNRNFFAEYVVCTLPFSIWLLARQRQSGPVVLLTGSCAFQVTALLMTGTRSALVCVLALLLVLPLLFAFTRRHLAWGHWSRGQRLLCAGVFMALIAVLGQCPTGNRQLMEEHRTSQRGLTPLARGFTRTVSIARPSEYTEGSFSVRLLMWKSTLRMIGAHAFSGVGAGAWEVYDPLYQARGSQVETDYYVHNEFLQLVAEYGAVGWAFAIGLLSYLGRASWRTWQCRANAAPTELPLRLFTLTSLWVLVAISCAGFPWRLAGTGALLAIGWGIMAASDARLSRARALVWNARRSIVGAWLSAALLLVAVFISARAFECEYRLVTAIKLALQVSESGQPNDPRWSQTRIDILRQVRQGIDINAHYRKLTPTVADELATWGDWTNAVWIWESVLKSRPYVVVILTNIARGYAYLGQWDLVSAYVDRARRIQPDAVALQALDLGLLEHRGQFDLALQRVRAYVERDEADFDTASKAFNIAFEKKEFALAIRALEMRIRHHPDQASDAWLRIGRVCTLPEYLHPDQALAAFRNAIDSAPDGRREQVRQSVPVGWRERL